MGRQTIFSSTTRLLPNVSTWLTMYRVHITYILHQCIYFLMNCFLWHTVRGGVQHMWKYPIKNLILFMALSYLNIVSIKSQVRSWNERQNYENSANFHMCPGHSLNRDVHTSPYAFRSMKNIAQIFKMLCSWGQAIGLESSPSSKVVRKINEDQCICLTQLS